MADAHPGLLWDGIHLTPAGAGVYTRLVARAVHAQAPAVHVQTRAVRAQADADGGRR